MSDAVGNPLCVGDRVIVLYEGRTGDTGVIASFRWGVSESTWLALVDFADRKGLGKYVYNIKLALDPALRVDEGL